MKFSHPLLQLLTYHHQICQFQFTQLQDSFFSPIESSFYYPTVLGNGVYTGEWLTYIHISFIYIYMPMAPQLVLVFCTYHLNLQPCWHFVWLELSQVLSILWVHMCNCPAISRKHFFKKNNLFTIFDLYNLSIFTSSKILKLKVRCVRYMFPLKLRTPNSLIYFPLISWVSVLNATYFKKKFLWKVLKNRKSNKNIIRSHFNTLSIKQNNSIEFFLRTYLATGSWLIIRPLSQL